MITVTEWNWKCCTQCRKNPFISYQIPTPAVSVIFSVLGSAWEYLKKKEREKKKTLIPFDKMKYCCNFGVLVEPSPHQLGVDNRMQLGRAASSSESKSAEADR